MKYIYLFFLLTTTLHVSAVPPTIPATNLSFNTVEGGFFNIGWTPGNGARRIMIVRANQPVTAIPQNGIDYTENTNFGSGQAIEPGQFVVYDNAFTSFFLTGLSHSTQYFFAVYEYNGSGAGIEYLTSSFLSGSRSTVSAPSLQASGLTFSNITATSMVVTCTAGNGARRLIVARQGSPVNSDPQNLENYSGNSAFGFGAEVGPANFSVHSSSGTSVTVTNLNPGTGYHFTVYEYNGNNEPVYKLPGIEGTATTRTIPTVPASNIITTKADGKALSIAWTNGNGQKRIVVARQGGTFSGIPVNGTDYQANSVMGSGATLAPGEFVVYNGTGSSTTVTGLQPATGYQFRIFEYDGAGTNTLFLVTLFGSGSAQTAVTPTLQASNLTAVNVLATTAGISWTNGNGRARLLLMRKQMPVSFSPADFTTYPANSDFGIGTDLGNGTFVMSSSNASFTTVHNLEPNTLYHVAVFEFNGFDQPLYLTPSAQFSFSTTGAVPVTLINWNAHISGGTVHLQWETLSEVNSSHFNIQRSSDGANFYTTGMLTARGNSQSLTSYRSTDPNPLPGTSYYRLQMVDLDGTHKYSPVAKVTMSPTKTVILKNPVNDAIVLLSPEEASYAVISSTGQVMIKIKAAQGRSIVDISCLPSGVYYLQDLQGRKNAKDTIKFIKL